MNNKKIGDIVSTEKVDTEEMFSIPMDIIRAIHQWSITPLATPESRLVVIRNYTQQVIDQYNLSKK